MNERIREAKLKRKQVEKDFMHLNHLAGITVKKNFLPKFVCIRRDGTFYFVDVKLKKTHKRNKDESRVSKMMKKHGINVYKWSPDNNWIGKANQWEKRCKHNV